MFGHLSFLVCKSSKYRGAFLVAKTEWVICTSLLHLRLSSWIERTYVAFDLCLCLLR